MDLFYSSVTSFCFVLMGLWWNVVQARREEWLEHPRLRAPARAVYMAFLIPGAMSLGAQLGGDIKIVWRIVFIAAAVFGAFSTVMFIRAFPGSSSLGWFRRHYWLAVLMYALIGVFGAFPEWAAWTGLKPLQVGGFLLSALVFIGVSFAWELMTDPSG
jgi:hypothetical protein